MKAAIYARVSTRDRGQDCANQVDQLRRFAAAHGYEIAAEYVDQDSGARADRPQFKLLFEHARRRQFGIVLFWALDRFSREGAAQTLNYLNQLQSYGVEFRSFTEQYIDSCGIFSEAVISILAVIAKQERIRLSERTIAGMNRARAAGKKLGRPGADTRRIHELAGAGMAQAEIARELRINRSTVCRALQV